MHDRKSFWHRPMIEVRNVSHWFGPKQVLQDISFSVAEREILAIMGSSGGGKTTMLRCMMGLLVPTEGDIEVDGISVRVEPEKAREVLGLMFQSSALFDYLSVSDNVAFGIQRKRRLGREQLHALVSDLLGRVGLAGTEHLMPSDLSGGMKKRVALARALAMEPKILLYDEPTSGLDPVTAYSIDQLIVDTRDDLGITTVVVSHDLSSVFRVADKIAFLDRGTLAFYGTPAEFRKARRESIEDLVEKARAESFLSESN